MMFNDGMQENSKFSSPPPYTLTFDFSLQTNPTNP
jgi:hypothetical protein